MALMRVRLSPKSAQQCFDAARPEPIRGPPAAGKSSSSKHHGGGTQVTGRVIVTRDLLIVPSQTEVHCAKARAESRRVP